MIGSSQPHWIEQTVDAPSPSTKLRISYGLVISLSTMLHCNTETEQAPQFEKCDQSILEPDVWTCHTCTPSCF